MLYSALYQAVPPHSGINITRVPDGFCARAETYLSAVTTRKGRVFFVIFSDTIQIGANIVDLFFINRLKRKSIPCLNLQPKRVHLI
jgi:hypothetical protein